MRAENGDNMSITPQMELIPKLKSETILRLLERKERIDKRGLEDFRPLEILTNYIDNAEGSAYVKLGTTQVVVGVKLEIGAPYPDTPNEGVLIVNAEFVPLASPSFEPGPPDENAIELARVIDRALREFKVIKVDELALIPGKKVWITWLDIYVLDHGGNLIDASSIAAMAALLTTKMPKVEVDESKGEVIVDKSQYVDNLPIRSSVVTITIGKIGHHLIVDPTYEEEQILDAKITIAVSDDGRIAGIQKAGMGGFTAEEVKRAVRIAISKAPLIFDQLKNVVGRLKTTES